MSRGRTKTAAVRHRQYVCSTENSTSGNQSAAPGNQSAAIRTTTTTMQRDDERDKNTTFFFSIHSQRHPYVPLLVGSDDLARCCMARQTMNRKKGWCFFSSSLHSSKREWDGKTICLPFNKDFG